MEVVWGLSRGNDNVHLSGSVEWFETFFDWFPYEGEPEWFPAMIATEVKAVRNVCTLMQNAVSDPAIVKNPSETGIIGSGWPERIAPVAKNALDLMLQRGRYSEDQEEDEPSSSVPWP